VYIGGTPEKPVGQFFIAVSSAEKRRFCREVKLTLQEKINVNTADLFNVNLLKTHHQ
jgi:nicotinamide mononucleotide (NMN) deamidase PncC